MIEAHVVQNSNMHLYARQFDEFLYKRHKYFAEFKKWVPESENKREIDKYDNEDATYILGIEDNTVVTSCRLIPTSKNHLVSDYFPHLCERYGVPRHENWGEWTRTFVDNNIRSLSRRGYLTQICCAVMEYALAEKISHVGGVQETSFLSQLRMLHWEVEPMGLARQFGDECYIVAYIKVTQDALRNAQRVLGTDKSLLVRNGPLRRFIDPAHRAAGHEPPTEGLKAS